MSQFVRMIKSLPPVTKNLIIINFIVWIACAFVPTIELNLHKYAALHFFEASDFNAVQLVTYMFMHGGFFHVFFNMFTLFFFGIMLEYAMGSKRFLIFYMVCGVGAALIQELVWLFTLPEMATEMLAEVNKVSVAEMSAYISVHPEFSAQMFNNFTTVGASGSIYGVLIAFAMLFPNRPLYFMFFPVPIKAKWMVLIWVGLELLLGMSNASDGVAHFAHLGGMIFGFLLIAYWKKKGIVHGDMY